MSFTILTLLQFVIVLGLLLFFHEFGHFLFARLFNIEVEEFGFGFPPRIARLFTWKGTEFTLNWIPFGAFVRPKGENDPEVPGGLAAANPWKRLLVLLGGPLMNVLLGIILFSVMFLRVGAPNTVVVQVVDLAPGSPAAQAGLKTGDVITAIDGTPVKSMDNLHNLVQQNLGQQVTLAYSRDGVEKITQLTPRKNPPSGEGPLGIVMGNPYVPVTIGQAVPMATSTAYEQAHQFVLLPVRLIRGQTNPEETRLVGPKGMFDIYQEAVRRDEQASTTPTSTPAVNVLWLMGTISIALGLTNLLPIPALDGGRILFVLAEILFRRRVPAQYENVVHLIGFAALLLLMTYVTFQDFANPILQP
ncbi:MAG TPA: M50 family metallopeptidase [Anaerolineaceae bacterium]|nr:M50 family metallopeptidase [Anaerolineaceae bacterium]